MASPYDALLEPTAKGQLEPGTVDLTKRSKDREGLEAFAPIQVVLDDGRVALIPTIADDGRVMNDDEAIGQYESTGNHLGFFESTNHASHYASNLHDSLVQSDEFYAKYPDADESDFTEYSMDKAGWLQGEAEGQENAEREALVKEEAQQAYTDPEPNPAYKQYTGPQPSYPAQNTAPTEPFNFKQRNWRFLNDGASKSKPSVYDALLSDTSKSEYDSLLPADATDTTDPAVTPMPELSPVAVESAPAVLENQPTPTSVPGPGNEPTPPDQKGIGAVLSAVLGLPARGIQGTFNTVAGSLTPDYWENPENYVPTDADIQTPLVSGETVGNILKTQIAGSPKVFEKSTGGLSGALRGILEGTGEALASFSTPESLALLPLGGGGKTAQRVIAGVFEGQAIAGTEAQWDAFYAAETTADKVRIATGMGLGVALPVAAYAHTFKKPPKPPGLAETLDPLIGDKRRMVPIEELPPTEPVLPQTPLPEIDARFRVVGSRGRGEAKPGADYDLVTKLSPEEQRAWESTPDGEYPVLPDYVKSAARSGHDVFIETENGQAWKVEQHPVSENPDHFVVERVSQIEKNLLSGGRKPGTRLEGPALIDAEGNVIIKGKIGETHADLMTRALKELGDDPASLDSDGYRVLEAFQNDAQHVFLDDAGNVLNREQAAPVGVKAGQLPEGTTKVQSQMLKAREESAAPSDRGLLHDEEKGYSDASELNSVGQPKTARTTPESKAHAENLVQTLQDGDVLEGPNGERFIVKRRTGKKSGRETISLETEEGNIVEGRAAQETDNVGKSLGGKLVVSDDLRAIVERSKVIREVVEAPDKTRVNVSIPSSPTGIPDLIDFTVEQGGVKLPKKGERTASHDDISGEVEKFYNGKLAGPNGKMAIDELAQMAFDQGLTKDPSVSTYSEALRQNVLDRPKTRQMQRDVAKGEKEQAATEKRQGKAFIKDVLKPDDAREKVDASNLQVGDVMTVGDADFKVTDIDPDTMAVTLEDGKKYGKQVLEDGQSIYVDTAAKVAVDESFAPAETPEVPTLRPGENQGDLLSKQTEDLTLVGEKGTDFGKLADEEAAAKVAAEEAKALQDELQQEFPVETEGPQGAIAPGGPQTLSALPPAAVTRPIKSQRQIITDLAKGLDIPIRFGRLRTNRFAGYFLRKADLIGAKRANDLTIVTHEVGHKLDQLFSFSGDPAIRSELNVLGDPTTPGSRSSWTKSKTLKYKYGEGIAEFVRHWLTDPAKALKDAPATHAAFEKILDANKDVGDVLRQAQGDIEVWRTSEAQARVRSHISVGDNPNKTRYTLSQLTRDLVDDLHILRLATEEAKRRGGNISPSQDPYLLARNLRGSYGMADTFVRSGIIDFKTKAVQLGTSLEDAFKPIAGRMNDFRDWIVSKQAKEMMRQGKETGLLANDVAEVVKRFESDKDFQSAFKAVKAWEDALLQYSVDAGGTTAEGAAFMRKMIRDYVPLHRVFEIGAGEASSQASMGTGSGLNAGKPGSMKSRQGSTRQIVDPIETMVKNAYAIITAAEKAAINNAVADLASLPGMGKWVEHIAAPKEQVKVSLEKIRQQLEDAGADISDLPDDLALSFFRQSGRAPFGENTIRIIKDGKPEFYRLNRDLFDTFQALDLEDSGMLVRMLSAPAQVLRSGVVLEPSFAIANALRDTFGAAVIGKHGALPFETTIRGMTAMIGNPKLVAEWAASGGKSAIEANYFDRTKLQKFVTERITKDLTPAEKALVIVKSPLTALRWLTGLSEEATRIGEYQIALNKLRKGGMPAGEARRLAAFEARDRQDFAKGGAKTKIVRHMAAFWNAALQGNVKLAQTFKERPVRTLMQGFAFVTIPKLLEQAVNWDDQDYWDRPQWERDLFFLIPAGKDENDHTRFIRIPTPFEVGVLFGTLPGRIIQYAKQNDPKALTSYFKTLLQTTVPNPMPQGAQMIFEDFLSGKQGWDVYRGRPIVPDSLADQPPEMQWTEQTTALAKKTGELLGVSPMKVDHMIGQTTGGLGKVLTGQQVPGKRFVTTPLAVSNQSTQDFYDQLDKLRAGKKRHEADESVEYSADKHSRFESAARDLSELRKELRDSETSAERKTQVREEIYQKVQEVMNQE